MVATKFQLEESKKPSPRYVLELHTIREMVQEANNMDKGLRYVLDLKSAAQKTSPMPQPLLQPPYMDPSSFAQPAPPVTPPATVSGSHLLLTTSFQAQDPGEAMPTPTPLPVPTVSTLTPQASTSVIAAPSPQTSEYSRAKPMGPVHLKRSINANLDAALPAPAVASIPTSSTLVNTKGDVKRVREAEADGTTLEVTSAPAPKRVKSD